MWETHEKNIWGVPHWILKRWADKFVEPGRFERQLTEDLNQAYEACEHEEDSHNS